MSLLSESTMAAATDIPEQLKANMHYFNLNNQLKQDLEQQNAMKTQQLEAIRLIQISLEKLTATATVPLHNQSSRNNKTTPPTILVYKETSLHKNLLVSKVLNKAKCFYYQSIVQTMRLSLVSKLTYYSSLIQQLDPPGKLGDETGLMVEMKMLMQQIIQEACQFSGSGSSSVTLANRVEPIEDCATEQLKQIKQLNEVKLSLNSLLVPQQGMAHNENNKKRKRDCSEHVNKRSRTVADTDCNNNHLILSDDTNVYTSNKTTASKRIKQHVNSGKLHSVEANDSFMNVKVLV